MPKAIPMTPIFTIGREMLSLCFPGSVILPAMIRSTLNDLFFACKNNKLRVWLTCFLLSPVFLNAQTPLSIREFSQVTTGSQRFESYLPLLKNKRVGIITNATGVIGRTSVVDTLISLGVRVKKIFGPEHGFRGDTEAGEKVTSNRDKKTGLPVISLYGSNKKPTKEQLKGIDVLVYDIQDLGVRFYTYISTLSYAMEACAENGKELLVLDRPNPNGFYIDGPVMTNEFKSFLGLHHVPLVYGMTCGEYAQMVNREGWLKNGVRCRLTIIALLGYDRDASYRLPVKPSPNIPNAEAALLYPSMGLFEGTLMSLGRGTEFPFQVVGHPDVKNCAFSFTPQPGPVSREPKYVNQTCYGLDLRKDNYLMQHPRQINLAWLGAMYDNLSRPDFFDKNFNYHAGNSLLQEQMKQHLPEEQIRRSWQTGLDAFRIIRKKYLLYPDFQQVQPK